MVDSFVMIIHSHGEYLLGQFLANDVPIEVFHNLLRWWWRFPLTLGFCVFDRLFGVHFTKHNEEVMTFLAFYEPCGTDEGFHVGTRVTALWAGENVLFVWRFLAVAVFATTGTGSGRAPTGAGSGCV